MKDKICFPQTVEFKSCNATIYVQNHRGKERYEVRYYDLDGSLQRLTFPSYATAKQMADTVVKLLAENREGFVTLRGREAYEYRAAMELLKPFGQSLLQAATAMTDGLSLLNGAACITEAVKYFVDNRPQKSPDITVREVVDQLLALILRFDSITVSRHDKSKPPERRGSQLACRVG